MSRFSRARASQPAPPSAPGAIDATSFLRDGPSAREFVTAQVQHLASTGALDAGNGDVLDAWLEGVRHQSHARYAIERTERVAAAQREAVRLEADVVVAEHRAAAAVEELEHTKRLLGVLDRQVLGPVEHQPADPRERRRKPRPTVDPLEAVARPWYTRIGPFAFLTMAALGDLMTFRIVLAQTFTDVEDWIVWILTLALAAASVGLMHSVGKAWKDLRDGRGGLGRVAIGLLLAGWLLLGAITFYFRYATGDDGAAAATDVGIGGAGAVEHDPLLSALLLMALFLGSGLLAFYAGFTEHHPRMASYLRLRARLQEQRADVTRTASEAESARQDLAHNRATAERAEQTYVEAVRATDAAVAELEELVRVLVAGHLGTPEATNGLTTGRRPTAATAPPAPRPPLPPTPFRLPAVNGANGHGGLNGNGHGPAAS
jgi:hypothetical protein